MTSPVLSPAQTLQNVGDTRTDAGSATAANDSLESITTRVLVTEQEVLLSSAAAISTPATPRHRRHGAMLTALTALTAAIDHLHIRLPEPRPIYRREAIYFETARMAREMDHL